MGFGGISIWQLLIILVIVLLLFGTKRLKNLGGDLGGAIKGFKKAMKDEGKSEESEDEDKPKETKRLEHDEAEQAKGASEKHKDQQSRDK